MLCCKFCINCHPVNSKFKTWQYRLSRIITYFKYIYNVWKRINYKDGFTISNTDVILIKTPKDASKSNIFVLCRILLKSSNPFFSLIGKLYNVILLCHFQHTKQIKLPTMILSWILVKILHKVLNFTTRD